MARTNCKPEARSSSGAAQRKELRNRLVRDQELPLHESFKVIHSPASGDHAVDGGRATGGMGRVPATPRLRPAGSRLPDDSGCDVLPGGRPRRNGVVGDFAAGAAVRTSSGIEPDDFHSLIWQNGYHAAVRTGPEHRLQ